MAIIYQSPTRPDQISFAIRDLIKDGLVGVRIAVAYTTRAGCENIVRALEEKLGDVALQETSKLLLTSFDFGHTEPKALKYWKNLPNGEVRIANMRRVQGKLRLTAGNTNFHPKVYLFDFPDRVATLVGSANLTQRALTVNTEVAVAEVKADSQAVDKLWTDSWHLGEELTNQLLNDYQTTRRGRSVPVLDSSVQRSQSPSSGIGHRLIDGINNGLNPSRFQYMWIQAGSMSSGGSRNQLELPRGANRFFGFSYNAYSNQHVTIGYPVLIFRTRRWTNRSLTWHAGGGQNAMERLNLPTATQGGSNYANMAILFQRTNQGFVVTLAPWGSTRANGWVNASALKGTLFRTGTAANSRTCGLF